MSVDFDLDEDLLREDDLLNIWTYTAIPDQHLSFLEVWGRERGEE